jgi:hypothetical protein
VSELTARIEKGDSLVTRSPFDEEPLTAEENITPQAKPVEPRANSVLSRPVFTYFALDGPARLLKIGRSTCVSARIGNLDSTRSTPLRLLGVIRGDIEGLLHGRFQHCRVRGEWFSVDDAEVTNYLYEMFGLGRESLGCPALPVEILGPWPEAEMFTDKRRAQTLRRLLAAGVSAVSVAQVFEIPLGLVRQEQRRVDQGYLAGDE